MLQIVCCAVPGEHLRKQAATALLEAAEVSGVYVDIRTLDPADDQAYGRELRYAWRDARLAYSALAVVEPDIVVRPDVITAFLDDPADYLCFPYSWTTDVGCALGCTRFSAAFIKRYPNLIADATATGVSWRQLDVVIMRHLLARRYGEQPKVCLPPVEHLNEAKKLLPEASPEPMTTVPHW